MTTQVAILLPEVPQGSSLAGDQLQGAEGPKDQGKGKEKKSPFKVKDAAKGKDAATKAKETKVGTKEANNKAKELPPLSQANKILLLPRRRLKKKRKGNKQNIFLWLSGDRFFGG